MVREMTICLMEPCSVATVTVRAGAHLDMPVRERTCAEFMTGTSVDFLNSQCLMLGCTPIIGVKLPMKGGVMSF